uniref:Uncharacterized protein n=1 Tax=Nicotiana tabacum TaxID=4097 RepID=A0A1S4AIN1_TOBAC|nr:PREDICTED: uncharacterized protein LOC107798114 [Nicotiana tabacum]
MTAPLNLEEGQSIYHPPKFDGKCYWWWKARMHDFIMAEDCELWDVICDGPFVIIKVLNEFPFSIKKTSGEYAEEDKKAMEKNFHATKILVYGLEPKEYDRVSTRNTAKEIWEALQKAYEGTTQVKQDKSNTDDSSTMAVEGEEIGYDSTLALMAQSDNDEDNDNKEKAIEILRKEKTDLLAETADHRELIAKPLTESKPESSERGKEIVSEEYSRLEDEVKALRCRMGAEIEKNELLQTNLEKVMNDLEKSLKWTWSVESTTTLLTNNSEKGRRVGFPRKKYPYNPHSKSATTSDSWPCTQCGNTGHSKEGVQAKNQSVPKDKVATKTGIVKGSDQKWFMDSGCSKHMTENTTNSGNLSCLKAVDDDAEL